MSEATDPAAPVLRVVRGEPTAEELAALVAVLAARAGAAGAAAAADQHGAPDGSAWTDRARYQRTTLPRGPGAWRASAWPR